MTISRRRRAIGVICDAVMIDTDSGRVEVRAGRLDAAAHPAENDRRRRVERRDASARLRVNATVDERRNADNRVRTVLGNRTFIRVQFSKVGLTMPRITLIIAIALTFIFSGVASAYDGIPNNCEHAANEDARNLVPRFVASNNSRLELVDWRTGDVMRVVTEGMRGVNIRDWSLDCRYIVISEWNGASTDTVVYDTHNNVRMGQVADAVAQDHPIRWGPTGYLMVESRNGAVLWHVPSGRQTVLTGSFNYSRVRNFTQIIWDSPNNQVLVRLAMGGFAAFDLSIGAEHPLSDDARAQLEAGRVDVAYVYTPNTVPVVEEDVCEPDEEANTDLATATGRLHFRVGEEIQLYGVIISCVDYDLNRNITASLEIPDLFDVLDMRIDPAQEYTNISDAVVQVRQDGITQNVTLHDPERTLKIERIIDGCTGVENRTKLTWVFTEGLSPETRPELRIDIKVVWRMAGSYRMTMAVEGVKSNPDDEGCND